MKPSTDDLGALPALPWLHLWLRALQLPFDTARGAHAAAAMAGAWPRSLLGWARFERWLDGAERLALGPWARRR